MLRLLPLLFLFIGCASIETVDRSLVAAPLLALDGENILAETPHTGVRGKTSSGGGACTVCAH